MHPRTPELDDSTPAESSTPLRLLMGRAAAISLAPALAAWQGGGGANAVVTAAAVTFVAAFAVMLDLVDRRLGAGREPPLKRPGPDRRGAPDDEFHRRSGQRSARVSTQSPRARRHSGRPSSPAG